MLNDGSQFKGPNTRNAVTLAGGDRVWQGKPELWYWGYWEIAGV
jgi:hypothetical protein